MLLESLITEHLPAVASSQSSLLLRPAGRAASRLRARLVAEATDDPELLRRAQEDLDDMKHSMSAERMRSGAQPIF